MTGLIVLLVIFFVATRGYLGKTIQEFARDVIHYSVLTVVLSAIVLALGFIFCRAIGLC